MKSKCIVKNFFKHVQKYMPLFTEDFYPEIEKSNYLYSSDNTVNICFIVEKDIEIFFRKEIIGYLNVDSLGIESFLRGYIILCNIFKSEGELYFMVLETHTVLLFKIVNKESVAFSVFFDLGDNFEEVYNREVFPYLQKQVKSSLERDIEKIDDLTQSDIDLLKILSV